MNKTEQLKQALQSRILILDGAMGSMIQTYFLGEADFRGERFADHPYDLQGNNEILNLTQPDIIRAIYAAYLEAGSDIITTNTFNGNAISQADYHTQDLAYEINFAAAKLAREAVSSYQLAVSSGKELGGTRGNSEELSTQDSTLSTNQSLSLSVSQSPRFIAGSLGPTNRTASISTDVQ